MLLNEASTGIGKRLSRTDQLPPASPPQVSTEIALHGAPRSALQSSLFLLSFLGSMPGHTVVKGLPLVPKQLVAKQSYCSSRTAAGHKLHGLHQQASACRWDARHRGTPIALLASLSSFGLGKEDVKEEADSILPKVPQVCKDIE